MKNLYFTIINCGYVSFALNFLKRLNQLDFSEDFLVVCTDDGSFDLMKNQHSKVIRYDCSLSLDFQKWGEKKYKDIVFNKIDINKFVLEKFDKDYNNIIYIDTDIWVNKNFSSDLNSILISNNYDLVFQDGEDYLFYKDECCVLEQKKIIKLRRCNSYCTGFIIMNCAQASKISILFDYEEKDKNEFEGNQEFINEKLYYLNLEILALPKKIFPNYSIPSFYKKNKDYWMLHYTYLEGSNKKIEMIKNNHWICEE